MPDEVNQQPTPQPLNKGWNRYIPKNPEERVGILEAVEVALEVNPRCYIRRSNAVYFVLFVRSVCERDSGEVPAMIARFIDIISRKAEGFNLSLMKYLKTQYRYNSEKSEKSYKKMQDSWLLKESFKMERSRIEHDAKQRGANTGHYKRDDAKDKTLAQYQASYGEKTTVVNTIDKLDYLMKYYRQHHKYWDFIFLSGHIKVQDQYD